MLKLKGFDVAGISKGNETQRFYSSAPENPTTVSNSNDVDDLDFLVDSLSENDSDFADLLKTTASNLSSLALTEDGQVTITSLRMQAGLTQSKLAEKIGQKQSNVSLIESGQRHNIYRETMRLMCIAFSCDMNTLDLALENSKSMLNKFHDQQDARACAIQDDAQRNSA